MGHPVSRRSVALVCIAAVLLAALVPGAAAIDLTLPEPSWTLLPDIATLAPPVPADLADLYVSTFVAPAPGRAPPPPRSHA